MGRAKRAIEALAELAPRTAVVKGADGSTREISVDLLQIGDTVIVKPNERLPADGFVVVGRTAVDQSPVTGESVPVDKEPVPDRALSAAKPDTLEAKNRVFAGTINGYGSLEIRSEEHSSELQSLMRISYAVFCLKKKTTKHY